LGRHPSTAGKYVLHCLKEGTECWLEC
jgi:hypothetical protein